MAFVRNPYDFIINCTEEQAQDDRYLSLQILRSITINRIEADKPSVILISGGSGEGKSKTALKIAEDILAMKGINFIDYLDDIVVYTPAEYAQKIDAILTEERLKKIFVFIIDEARGVVSSKSWNSFVNQAIADVNAVSRGVKPLVIIIISQDVSDIDKSTRKTIRYELKCSRPLHDKTRVSPFLYYSKRWSVEKIDIREKRLYGQVRTPIENYTFTPTLVVNQVGDNIWHKYRELEQDRKVKLIRARTRALMNKVKEEMGDTADRVGIVFDDLIKKPDKLKELTVFQRGKIRLNEKDLLFSDWSTKEKKELEDRLKKYGQRSDMYADETKP